MLDLKDHVVSIYNGVINKGGIAKGSGFCIAPTFVLTAHHVVKNIDLEQLHIGLVAGTDSGRRVKKIHFIDDDYDAVILELHKAHQKPVLECDLNYKTNDGQTVELIAYHVDESNPIGPLEKQVSNMHRDDKHRHFDSYPAKGMSGGAVLYKGKAIGIIRAQSKENNDGVFLPLHLIKNDIKKILAKNTLVSQEAEAEEEESGDNKAYLKAQRDKLLRYLTNLKKETEEQPQQFYRALLNNFLDNKIPVSEESLQEALLKNLDDNASELVKSLRECCEPYAENLQHKIEELLLLLLTQLADKEIWINDSLYTLNVRTRILSELQMAAHYEIKPTFKKHEGLGMAGTHVITEDISCKELGIDFNDNAQLFAETIALKLYKQFDDAGDFSIDDMDKEEWAGVNETIKELREIGSPEFHRIEIDTKRTKAHPLLNPNICNALYKLLPDLPITHFGHEVVEGETQLRSQVSIFFDMLSPKT